jgi:threonine/homoserine/homoserine lactone efflux protein
VTFVAVGSGSPGPNNTLLLASGIAFGLRRTLPHVVGTSVGITLLVAIAALGEEALIDALPGLDVALKALASAYLLYLAFRLAGGIALDPATATRPFRVVRATLFQFINPKAWVFALALVSAFASSANASSNVGIVLGSVAIVVAAMALLWALGGTTLRRVLGTDRARRTAGVVLAVLLVASVALLWL